MRPHIDGTKADVDAQLPDHSQCYPGRPVRPRVRDKSNDHADDAREDHGNDDGAFPAESFTEVDGDEVAWNSNSCKKYKVDVPGTTQIS